MSNDQVQSRQGLTETCSTTQILSDLEHRLSTKTSFIAKYTITYTLKGTIYPTLLVLIR